MPFLCSDSDRSGVCEWAPATHGFLPVTLAPPSASFLECSLSHSSNFSHLLRVEGASPVLGCAPQARTPPHPPVLGLHGKAKQRSAVNSVGAVRAGASLQPSQGSEGSQETAPTASPLILETRISITHHSFQPLCAPHAALPNPVSKHLLSCSKLLWTPFPLALLLWKGLLGILPPPAASSSSLCSVLCPSLICLAVNLGTAPLYLPWKGSPVAVWAADRV